MIKTGQAAECAWTDWCNLIVAQVTTKYKIPTKNYVNIRPHKHNESPKSKHAQPEATYFVTANTETK